VAFEPQDSNTIYAATDGGIFKSQYSGAHWRAAASRGVVPAENGAKDFIELEEVERVGHGEDDHSLTEPRL
jgi:hypothetical protein